MEATSAKPTTRRGFTLIEMLAVVVIIGILASLITAAAIMARTRARKAVVKLEIDQLNQALDAYKAKFGDYPPDFTNLDAVEYHLAKAFPKWSPVNYPVDFSGHSPATALLFWLGGIPDPVNPKILTGFSANPENPFEDVTVTKSRIPPFFDFDQTRVQHADPTDVSSPLVYYPNVGIATPSNPYIYFRARPGGKYDPDGVNGPEQKYPSPEGSVVRPYYDALLTGDITVNPVVWVNPKKFQILCAGLDDVFGIDHAFKDDTNYGPNDYDNITNFTNITLEDDLP